MNFFTTNPTGGTTTTYYIYETVTETVTVLPYGDWYQLKIAFNWEAWVNPADYQNLIIGFTDLSYVGQGEHTFTAENNWYTFTTPYVLRDASVYIYLSNSRYVTELDYNLASAGPWSSSVVFWDSSMPMPIGPAGSIMWTWVEI